jgi:hypothetical protein
MTLAITSKIGLPFYTILYTIYLFKKRHFSRKSINNNFDISKYFTLNKTSFKNELLIKIRYS